MPQLVLQQSGSDDIGGTTNTVPVFQSYCCTEDMKLVLAATTILGSETPFRKADGPGKAADL